MEMDHSAYSKEKPVSMKSGLEGRNNPITGDVLLLGIEGSQ